MTSSMAQLLTLGLWVIPVGWCWRRRPGLGSFFRGRDPAPWTGARPIGGFASGGFVSGEIAGGRGPGGLGVIGDTAGTRLVDRSPAKAAVAIGLLGLSAWWFWPLPASVVVWAGVHRFRRAGQRGRERAAAADQAANLAALLELALYGGVSLRRALHDVLPWTPPPLGSALSRVLLQVEAGSPLVDELEALVTGPHSELEALWRLVRAVERDGIPAGPALSALAAEGRLERRHRLERSARRLPLRLLLPLTGGVLPAFVLLAVVPMLAAALAGLR